MTVVAAASAVLRRRRCVVVDRVCICLAPVVDFRIEIGALGSGGESVVADRVNRRRCGITGEPAPRPDVTTSPGTSPMCASHHRALRVIRPWRPRTCSIAVTAINTTLRWTTPVHTLSVAGS